MSISYSAETEGDWGSDTTIWEHDAKDFQDEKSRLKKALDTNDQEAIDDLYKEKMREAIIDSSPGGGGGGGKSQRMWYLR